MQVFVPYRNPYEVARALDKKRLNKQIVECGQILRAISDLAAPWSHHPVVAMWRPWSFWLFNYMNALICYRDGRILASQIIGHQCSEDSKRPPFLTEEFCIQHRRRLYTKEPEHYAQFGWEVYGTSEENWYCVDGKLVRYIKGKKI